MGRVLVVGGKIPRHIQDEIVTNVEPQKQGAQQRAVADVKKSN